MKKTLNEFLAMTDVDQPGENPKLYFYGDIVSDWWGAWQEEDQYPTAICNFLSAAQGRDIDIYINSGGGAVFAGMAIYNMLKRYSGQKTVYVDGVAASIASIIALAGDRVIIPENAYFMVHRPWTCIAGNAAELRKAADALDTLDRGATAVYQEFSQVDEDQLKKYIEEETWFTGKEAAEIFSKVETVAAVDAVAKADEETLNQFRAVPKMLKREFAASEDVWIEKEKNIERERLALLGVKGEIKYES